MDTTTTAAPGGTDQADLIAAAAGLVRSLESGLAPRPDDIRLVLAQLPDAVTSSAGALPTAPGWYQGFDKVAQSQVTVRLADNGNWGHGITGSTFLAAPGRFAPFTPLVPERPRVTRGQVSPILRDWHAGLIADTEAADQIAALVNGAAQ